MPECLRPKLSRARAVLLLCALVSWLFGATTPAAAQRGCEADNLMPNCNFNNFRGSPPRQTPEGWTPFVLAGDLTFKESDDTAFGAPSLMMWSDGGTFVAGVYSQVGGLQPGTAYKASMGWGAPNEPNAFGRRLGIDPTGGADPTAATVSWGPTHRGYGRRMNCAPITSDCYANIDVSVVARASTVTVFVYVDHNYSTGSNYIFIDAVSLAVDTSQPTATPVLPTPLPPPPVTAPPLPTFTPIPPTATVTPTPTATATHTATPTPTVTPTPTQTSTPSVTPSSTLPPRPTATAAPGASQPLRPAARSGAAPVGLLWGGIGALGGAAALGGWWLLLRRRR